MDKQRCIARVAQNEEDKLLFAKIYDRLTSAEQKNILGVTGFLSPREQALTKQMLPLMNLTFYGGLPDAERAICAWVPDYFGSPEDAITAVRATYYEADDLTHRDILGGLMGIGIKRETVGDIYVGKGSCDFLVTSEILPYVLDNFLSAGRTKLHLETIAISELNQPIKDLQSIRETVSSLRLDSIVGAGFRLARGKAAELIKAGVVSINDLPCQKSDKLLSQGDKITVHGSGKCVLTEIGGKTKKDRISIVLERYC